MKTYEAKDALEDVMKENPKAINEATKRCIIYTAMLVAGADGYCFRFLTLTLTPHPHSFFSHFLILILSADTTKENTLKSWRCQAYSE